MAMDNAWAILINVFCRVSQVSGYAVGAIIIIRLIQMAGRRWLPAKWSYALWLILLVRMALPVSLESEFSLWNIVAPGSRWMQSAVQPERPLPGGFDSPAVASGRAATAGQGPAPGMRQQDAATPMPVPPVRETVLPLLSAIWLAGALSLAVGIVVNNLRLWYSVRELRLVTDQSMLELFEDCKQQMQVRTIVGLVVTSRVKSPSLFGFVRPRILLPADLIGQISPEELRYIFFHELAHLKRGDIRIGWIVALLQSLHWFNPVIWWAFARMRADRELACDALALSCMRSEDNVRYGGTLINLLERFSHTQRLPMVAGILENKTQLKRRLTMIAEFRRPARRTGILAAALVMILSAGLLTDAKDESPSRVLPAVTGANVPVTGSDLLNTRFSNKTGPASKIQRAANAHVNDATVNPTGKGADFKGQTTHETNAPAGSREPIVIGDQQMEAKLIHKVEPVYPRLARRARVSARVILVVTVDEEGYVTDVRVTRGHPLLNDAAVSAVRQWQYSPTFLKGEGVPVVTMVTVVFDMGGDEAEAVNGARALPGQPPVQMNEFAGRDWCLVSRATPIAEAVSSAPNVEDFHAPELALTLESVLRWKQMAEAGLPADVAKGTLLAYSFVLDEFGRVKGFSRTMGPEISDLERELSQLRVISPGFRGSALVRFRYDIELGLGLSIEEVHNLLRLDRNR